MSGAEERRLELERKKRKLAEIREQKNRANADRRETLLASAGNGIPSTPARQTLTTDELSDILRDVGIDPTPQQLPTRNKHDDSVVENGINGTSPRGGNRVAAAGGRIISLDYTQPLTVTAAPKEPASYTKTTQTDEDKFSMGEFSTGSQEFDYDDDMLPVDKHPLDMHFDGSPTDDLAAYLPYSITAPRQAPVAVHEEEKKAVEEEKPQRLPDLSEEEKSQIMSSEPFHRFFAYSSKVVMRALAEDDIFINYALDTAAEVTVSGEQLTEVMTYVDPKWTLGRRVVGLSFSEQHPELLAVGYDEQPEMQAGEAMGVVVVWNTKFKRPLPEYVFYSYSRLTSVAFARFNPHLIIGGCYSGQLVLWDMRTSKKTPCNKSPLSAISHTHPVYSLSVVGSSNAHNVVSVSTDGKLCAWSIEQLSAPVETKEIVGKAVAGNVAVLCAAFPADDVNNLIICGEDGGAYYISRHGATSAEKIFEASKAPSQYGHFGPVSGCSFHPATTTQGNIDFSHLFLTASLDWTVKLWSIKHDKLRLSLDAHTDYVFDVAWSPAHPALFASVDAVGNLFLWNLNEDSEVPVARYQVGTEEEPLFIRKLAWSPSGQQLFVGLANGEVRMYDVHESLHTGVKPEEWAKFACVLADIQQAVEESEEAALSEHSQVLSSITSSPIAASLTPRNYGSPVAALAGGVASAVPTTNTSPRSLGF